MQESKDIITEHIKLDSKSPTIFGEANDFLALGKLLCRGDKFLVFMHLKTGKVYIEETFAKEVLGDFLVGLNEVKDDKLWGKLVYAANGYGLTSKAHILDCLKKLNIKIEKVPLLEL